mgnify:FL=1
MRTTRLPRFRRFPWLCLLLLALAADAAWAQPDPGFRALARGTQQALGSGDYEKAEIDARELYQRYGKHSDTKLSAAAHVLFARVLHEQGRHAEAEALLRQGVALREKGFGETDPRTIGALFQLGKTLAPQGKYADAQAILQRALDRQRRVGRPGHPQELKLVNHIANLKLSLGRTVEAEALLKKALDDSRDANDNKILRTRGGTYFILTRVLLKRGRYAEAETAARAAQALYERTLGAEHPDTARNLNQLGRALIEQKKIAEAKQVLPRALALHLLVALGIVEVADHRRAV